MAKVGVLGAGSWGTALAILLHDNGHDVTVWSIDPKEVEMLSEKREHVSKLPGVHISEEIMITNEMEEAIKGKDFLVLAVPSIFTRSTAAKMKPYVVDGQMIVDVAKGIEEDTLMTLSQQISQEIPQADVAVLSLSLIHILEEKPERILKRWQRRIQNWKKRMTYWIN